MRKLLFVYSLMTCFLLPSYSQPVSAEIKGVANETSLTEATAAMKPVNAYYAVHKLSPNFNSILLGVRNDPESIDSARPKFFRHLNEARTLLSAAEIVVESMPPISAKLSGEALQRAKRVRQFIPKLKRVTHQVVLNWELQFEALERKDYQNYQLLVDEDFDASITILEAVGIIGRASLAAVDERGSGYNVQESIVLGNEFLVAYLKFVQGSNTVSEQSGLNSISKMEALVDEIEATIANGNEKLEIGYVALGELNESDFTMSAAASFECLQRSLAVEQEIHSEFENYLKTAKLIKSSSLGQDGLESLAQSERHVALLAGERSKLKFECYELATVVASHMK